MGCCSWGVVDIACIDSHCALHSVAISGMTRCHLMCSQWCSEDRKVFRRCKTSGISKVSKQLDLGVTLQVVGQKIAQLEARKRSAVEKEDYDTAKTIKVGLVWM